MRKRKAVLGKQLEATLEKNNSQYYENFLDIKSRRESDFATITSKEGTFDTHGPSHLDNIQEKLSELLGVNGIKRLNNLELYTLLCAIWLHDISMAYTNRRANHPSESADIVENSIEYTWINNDIKYIIADIIRSHGINDFEEHLYKKYHDGYSKYIEEERINVGILMALLRIGDIMDWAYDRAPLTVREGMPVIGESFYYWYRHEPIESIVPNRQEKKIVVSGRRFGKFSCRILNEEISMLNRELNSNRQQLAKLKLNYECFEFDFDTEKKILETMEPEENFHVFHPFISYKENEYLRIHGREKDEEILIRLILRAREDKTVSVLTAESGDGKTSLLKARIIEDFMEMGFETVYFDDVSEALHYLNINFNSKIKNVRQGDKNNSIKWDTNRYLIIMDQIERSFAENKVQDLKFFLENVRNLIHEEDYHNRVVYFVFSVPDIFVNQLGQILSTFSLELRIHFLKKVNIKSVIISILKQENIDYDEGVINDIINCLFSSKNADITNVHILFQTLIETNRLLLVKREYIVRSYKSIEMMVQHMMENYFKDKFSQLTNVDKMLLKRACNYDGSGTHRVYAREGEDAKLQVLTEKNFIRLYENNMAYEFVHDILARRFYDDVLEEHDKEISMLLERIHNDTLDNESLLAIQRLKDEIALNDLKDDDIANLIFVNIMNKSLSNEANYWMEKYVKPNFIIEELILRIEKSINLSGMLYVNMLSITKKMPFLFECADKRQDLDEMVDKLKKISGESVSYRRRCIASEILEKFKDNVGTDEVDIPVCFSLIYHKVLIEPAYEEMFREAYCYLLHYALVDLLITEKQLERMHFLRILSIFLTHDKKKQFYSYEYNNKDIDHIKFEMVVSMITPKIVEMLNFVQGENSMELRHGNISFALKRLGYERDGIRTDIKTAVNFELLLKFSYKEDVDILFQKENRELPIAFLKKKTKNPCSVFTKNDVISVIRQYKINFVNDYYKRDFTKNLWMRIPEKTEEKLAWLIAKNELENAFHNETVLEEFHRHILDQVYGIKLLLLYKMLCYLNYLNLQLCYVPQFIKAKIILLQTEEPLKNTGLYDKFYVELEGNDDKQKFDPDGISGIRPFGSDIVDFHLLTVKEKIIVKDYTIKKEMEFCGNGSSAIAIGTSPLTDCILEKYKDSFSFRIMWDDKVNRVSNASDAWEYELTKLFVLLKENSFITDIFVFGDIMRCKKTVQTLKYYCKNGKYYNMPDILTGIEIKGDISKQYFGHMNVGLLEKVRLHIFNFESDTLTDNLEIQISDYFLQNYNTVIQLEVMDVQRDIDLIDVEEVCRNYLKSIGSYKMGKSNAICVDSIDNAYKAMLASLICFGNKQIDSAGKDILDLRGVTLNVKDIDQNGYHLAYRREDIEEYYEMQWIDDKGVIKKIADSTDIFSVNQIELITEELENTIKHQLGNRKLAIIFYAPNDDSISEFRTPSLLECFLMPRYQGKECLLDVIFVWRTNECVLGLPMSLESSIRWIYEKIVSKLGDKLRIGNYTYFGVSMHCADNFIMRKMIANVIGNI